MAKFLESASSIKKEVKKPKKKKQETTQQKVKSPSVSNTQRARQAQNQKMTGGYSKPQTVRRSSSGSSQPNRSQQVSQQTQRTVDRLQQKYGVGPANSRQATRRTQPRNSTISRQGQRTVDRLTAKYGQNRIEKDPREERRRQERLREAQRQKMGLNSMASRETQEAANRAIKNTPSLVKKAVKDTVSGHLSTIADLTEMTASNKNGTQAKAMKMGIQDNPEEMRKLEQRQQQTVEKAKLDREKWAKEQDERQKAWDKKVNGATGAEKAYYGAVESGTGMLTDLALGLGTQGGSLGAMFSRTYGQTRGQAEKEGATENEDRTYAFLQAAKEVGTELMFPGVGLAKGYAKKTGLPLAERVANNLTKNIRNRTAADIAGAGVRLLGGTAEENAEEFAGWGLDPIIKEFSYGRNVRTRQKMADLQTESDELRSSIQSEDDARRVASYLNSSEWLDQNKQQYMEAGLSEKKAEEVAEKMRDYMTASLTGDTKTMEALEKEIASTLSKGEFSYGKSLDKAELLDTLASTTLLTMTTGLPGTATTAMRGSVIRDNLGTDGIRTLAESAMNYEDAEASKRGEVARDRINAGKELTSSQVYELAAAQAQQVEKDTRRVVAKNNVVADTLQSEKLVAPMIMRDDQGNIQGDKIITQRYNDSAQEAENVLRDIDKEQKLSLSDSELAVGSRAIAGFQTGAFTINDANALNYTNTAVRDAFEKVTGIDLGQYVVKTSSGAVDYAATNAATKDALFAMAADNFLETARAETENFKDQTRGITKEQMAQRIGSEGDKAMTVALGTVDPADEDTYGLMESAAQNVYEYGRYTEDSWDDVSANLSDMYPGLSQEALHDVYEAAKRDKTIAENPYYNAKITAGESTNKMDMSEAEQTEYGKFTNETGEDIGMKKRAVLESIASEFGINIRLLPSEFFEYKYVDRNGKEKTAYSNGSYDPKTGTMLLNGGNDMERNIIAVALHEITHHIAIYAPNEYLALSNRVMEAWYKNDADSFSAAIQRKQDSYKAQVGQNLSEEQALEEVIADAMGEMNSDPDFISQICTEEPSLANQIINAIRSVLRKLRAILASGNVAEEHEDAFFSQLNMWDEAQRLWLEAAKVSQQARAEQMIDDWDANARETASEETEEPETRQSINDEDYMAAVERGDMRKAQNMVDDAAIDAMPNIAKDPKYKTGRVPLKLYHGTPNFGFTQFKDSNYKVPFIYTSTDNTVSAHYAGDHNYASPRQIGKPYREGNSTEDIIENAKTVWDTDLKKMSTEEKKARYNEVKEEASKVADRIDELYPGSWSAGETVDNAIAWVEDLFFTVRDGDYSYNFDEDDGERTVANEILNDSVERFKDNIGKVKEYRDEHYKELDDNVKAFLNYLCGYDVGDAAIDIEYGMQRVATEEDRLVNVGGSVSIPSDLKTALDQSRHIGAYTLYGDLGDNPLEFDADGAQFWAVKVPQIGDEYMSTDSICKWAYENGYTSVIMHNIYDYGDKADNYVFFDSSQLKSADPVTYDDNGNVIPLSERFNEENTDIRFSLNEPVERVKDLIAVHNLKADDIRNTFDLGGFPMPSIAVTKDSMGHDLYGDITLMFHSDTIDPEFFRSNQVFGGDAWTPTFPSIAKKVSRQVADRIDQRLRDILGLGRYDYTLGDLRLPSLDDDNLTNALRYNEPYDAFKNDEVFQIAYLKDAKNFDVAIPTKEGRIRSFDKEALEYLDDRLPELTYDDIYNTVDRTMEFEPAVRQARKDYYESKGGIKSKGLAKHLDEEMGYSDVISRLEATIKYREEGIPEVTDRDALRDKLNEEVDQDGFKAWIDNLFEGIIEKTGIRNNKDMFTASGNRRSWEALHDPVTLENVVKVMKSELAAGGTGLFGSNPKGAAQKQYKSLDEIRDDEDRLQKLSEEEYKAQSEVAVGKMSEVCTSIAEHNPGRFSSSFGAALDVGSYVAEILNSTRNKAAIKRKLTADYNLDVTDEQMNDLMDAIDAIANLPTGYFEAKPRRAVGFDEVKAAIIPASTDEDIKQGFSDRGIQMYEYDPDVEGDRTVKVNQAASENDLRFSISEDLDEPYMAAVNAGNMEEAQEYVDEAAKRAGYKTRLYHGTTGIFDVFDRDRGGGSNGMSRLGFWFTETQEGAQAWAENSWWGDNNKPHTIGAYIKLKNPKIYETTKADETTDKRLVDLRERRRTLEAENQKLLDKYGRFGTVFDYTMKMQFNNAILRRSNGVVDRDRFDSEEGYQAVSKDIKAFRDTRDRIDAIQEEILKIEHADAYEQLKIDYYHAAGMKTEDALVGGLGMAIPNEREAVEKFREQLKAEGYDGIIIRNTRFDSSIFGGINTQYVVFEPEQVKSADPVTYAEDGSVIPLSERFDPTNNDIRYSMSTEDADGNVLTTNQMEYFKNSQARDENGRLVPVYHTTSEAGFTVFDPLESDDHRSLFFTNSRRMSASYSKQDGRTPPTINPYDVTVPNTTIDDVNNLPDFDSLNTDIPDIISRISNIKIMNGWDEVLISGDDFVKVAQETGRYLEKQGYDLSDDFDVDPYLVSDENYASKNGIAWELYNGLREAGLRYTMDFADPVSTYVEYLNLENPLIVDAQGHVWDDIPFRDKPKTIRNASLYLEPQWDNTEDGDPLLLGYALTVAWEEIDDSPGGQLFGGWSEKKIETTFDNPDSTDTEWYPLEEMGNYAAENGLSASFLNEILSEAEENPMDGSFSYESENSEEEVNIFVSSFNTRGIAEIAESEGYDGVIIRTVVDYGDWGYGNTPEDVYIAFSANQVKDVRNENPTENPDIRYSITEDEGKSKKDYEHATDMSYEELLMYEDMISNASESYDIESAFGKAFDGEKVSNFYSALTEEVSMVFDDEILEEGRMRMAKSKADFWSNLNTKWQERWETKGEVLDTKSVKTNVRNLIRGVMNNSDTDRQYKTELVNKTLMDMRVAYQLMKQDRTDIASALLYHSALRMITDVDFIQDDTEYQEYKGIRDYLRGEPITVGEDYWQSKAFQQFRKEHYGILKLRKGANGNIGEVYAQLENLYPHIFSEAERSKNGFKDDEEDLLQYIGFVTEQNMQPFMEAYSSEYCADWAFEIADDLYEIMENGEGVTSLADRYKAKYDAKAKAMKTRHAEAILRVRKQKQAAIDALKEQYNERLDRQKELARDAIRREREKFRQQKQDEKERTKERMLHSKYFDSIVKSHKTLSDRLLTNTKDKHIPEQYKNDLAELLAAFDLQTVASKKLEIRNGLYYRQNYQSQKTIRMKALQETLANIQADSQLFYVNDSITEIIDRLLGKNAEGKTDPLKSVEGRTIDELTASELKDIDKLLKALIHEFNNYESVRTGAKRQQAADIATSQIDSCLDHAGKFGEGLDYQNFLGALDNILNLDEVTPAYMFRQIDPQNNGIGMMFKELRRSFGKYVRNQNQLNEWMDEIIGEYNNNGRLWNKYGSALEEWRISTRAKEFQLTNGNVKLTPAQMMSIYCLSHRQQAYDHMTGAGIVVQPVSFQARMASDLRKRANYALPVILTDSDIKLITSKLTPDQIKVADKLQELMATKMAEWGNEASMSVMGIRLFEDPDYFPIKSDKAALEKDFSAEQFMDCIRNFGFTKAVQPGARNAIAIGDIFDVVAEHCNNMNLYNAYSEAMNDFMKVYNFHAMREDGSDYSVEQAIAHAYSKKATTFITSFMKDLNGNVSRERTTGIEQMMNDSLGKAKKASVFANGRVALQQPTALMRAFAVISPKYLKGVKAGKATMQEMFEHSPIALWKSWGYYDINMGKSIEDLMMNNGSWAEDKMSDLYGELDNRTWAVIWTMCKNEIEDKHKDVEKGSDEYWELVSERFDEVVDLTQVVDSPFHRSHAMRSKNTLTKMATAFMAEPTLTYNMVRDGFRRAKEEYRLGNKGKAGKIVGRTVSVFVLSAWATSAAAAIWDAVRGKAPGGDDDDDEQGFFDMWFDNMIENLKDNLLLLNNIYYIKDVVSLFQGWDQRNLGLQGWKHFADAYGQLTGRKVSSKLSWYENMLAGIGYLTGVPLKTMLNDGKAIFKMFGLSAPGFITDQLDKLDSIGSSTKDMNRGASSSTGISDPKTSSKSTAVNLWTYDNAPFRIEDGSAADNFLNHFGINLTSAEIAAAEEKKIKAEREKKVEDIKAKTAGMSGVEKDKKVWSYISSQIKKEHGDMPVSSIVEAGDYNSIYEYREMYVAAGGNTDYFDERIFDASKKAMKKSIVYNPTDAQIEAQDNIRNYLTDHGMTESELSEIAYKSYTAKELKVAFRLNDEDAIVEELTPLVRAGLSLEDFHRIYDNRNRIDLKKYKESGGKYAEKLKSMGDYNWPCNGTITSTFGHRSSPGGIGSTNHQGIDIGASMGAPVTAADGGVVVRSGWYGGYGKTVQIQHDDGTITQYSHLSWWEPKVGDVVAQGQEIGKVGSTGNSTGPHLHFGVMKNGEYVDPMDYLNKKS